MDRAYRLSEIIARVAESTKSGATYVVLRPKSGGERQITISTLATGDLNDDPYVSPGDKYSPPADSSTCPARSKAVGPSPCFPT